MARYMIHTCNVRRWYVDEYLVPSMLQQGISESDIDIYQDVNEDGNLLSTMKSFGTVAEDGGTWHLQDDILISSRFKELTELYDDHVVCGFASSYDKERQAGEVKEFENMWLSFPCIRIPNKIARDCSTWFFSSAVNNSEYRMWIRDRKFDDSLFRIYLGCYYLDEPIYNLVPNIVEHIDYLIGGSLINYTRSVESRSIYWDEPELVDQLEKLLNGVDKQYIK